MLPWPQIRAFRDGWQDGTSVEKMRAGIKKYLGSFSRTEIR